MTWGAMRFCVTARNSALFGACTAGLLLLGGCETTPTAPADAIGPEALPAATRLSTLPEVAREASERIYSRAMVFSRDFSRVMYQAPTQSDKGIGIPMLDRYRTFGSELRENDAVLETFENVDAANAVRMAYGPDGRTRMYAVTLRPRNTYFVVNDKQHRAYNNEHDQIFLQFSKSGDYFYAVGTWQETTIVRNGVVFQKVPYAIKKISISEDGRRITYLTRIRTHENTPIGDRIVTRDVDGRERVFVAQNMGINDFETDANHEHVIYTELAPGPVSPKIARLVYANGQQLGGDYQQVTHMGFTPKRKQPFFVYAEKARWRLPYDPKKLEWKDKLGGGVVFAGHASQFKEAVGDWFAVTADETGIIYFTRTAGDDGWIVWEQNEAGRLRIREKHFSVLALEADPHTGQLNICFREERGVVCRIRDRITNVFSDLRGPIVYSPDHRSFAFKAIHEAKVAIVVNGRVLRTHDQVWGPVFTDDGRHIIYAAARGPEIWRFIDPVVEAGR